MKLLNVTLARSIWLFPTEELNPHGLDIAPVLWAIKERYRFQRFPQKPEEIYAPKDGVRFGDGTFKMESEPIAIKEFTIHGDGVVVETLRSTEASDAFISDMLAFVTQQYRLTFDAAMLRSKIYINDMIVSTEFNFDTISKRLTQFGAILSEKIGLTFKLGSLRFSTEPRSGRPVQFVFERRAGANFDDKRYWSEAPLTTQDHLAMLDQLEKILSE
jgi:hypothetical protein